MYYNVMTMTVMVILNSSSSLKEKQDDRYDLSEIRLDSAPCAHGTHNEQVLTRRLEYGHRTCQNTFPW
jgi:hypothetical protein